MLTGPVCDAQILLQLQRIVDAWIRPRERWFGSLQSLLLDLDLYNFWASPGMLDTAGRAQQDLITMPAVGSA